MKKKTVKKGNFIKSNITHNINFYYFHIFSIRYETYQHQKHDTTKYIKNHLQKLDVKLYSYYDIKIF